MRLNIRLKLVAFTVCVILLVGGSISLYFIYQGRQRVLTTFEEDSGQVASVISGTIVNDLYSLDVHALRLKLESARTNPDISYIYVIDLQGVVLVDGTNENALRNRKLTDNFSEEVLRSAGWVSRLEGVILKVGGPIFMPDRSRIGYLLLGFSLDPAYRIIRETTRSSLYITVICLGIGVVLAFIIATSFSLPILSIVQAAKEIGEGRLDTGLRVNRRDELGTLAGSINRMAESLQQRRAETKKVQEELQARYKEMEALYEMGQTVLGSPDLKTVLEKMLDQVLSIFHLDIGNIRMFRSDGSMLIGAYQGYQDPGNVRMHLMRVHGSGTKTGSLVPRVIASKKSLAVEDVPAVEGMSTFKREGVQSAIIVPIFSQEEGLGIIEVGSRTPRKFHLNESHLLEAIGNQMGVAVQKAQLFEEIQQRARQQEALNAIATATSRSLDLKELFEIALDKTVEVTGRSRVNMRLKDPLTGRVEMIAHRGFSDGEIEELRRRTPHPMSEEVFASGNPLIINDTRENSSRDFLERTGSVAWVPIKAGARVVGVLGISDNQSKPFSASEVELLEAIGSVIGVAIENARLFGETKRNLEGIRALHEIDMAITSTLDLHDILAVLLEKIELFLPYSTATVRLFNKDSGLLEPVACRNLDEAEWKVAAWKPGRGPANVVFESKTPLVIRNCLNDPRVKDPKFFRKHQLVSYMGVPMFAKEEILGVLSFYTKEEHEFAAEEVEFLTTLAGQAAIAIHNSEVYEELAKLANDLSRSNRVKDEFLSVMSHELRTPLNVVMGYTGMIRDRLLGEINPEQEKALEKVITRARDQLVMISSILQATQLEAEGVKVEPHEVNLEEFLDDLKLNYALALGKELNIVWDYPPDLPAINTDSEKLKYVLQNLINNAIKFTEKGTVTISARYLDGTQGSRQQAAGSRQEAKSGPEKDLPTGGGSWMKFQVADTGIGIAEEFFPVIFERFRQVDSSETRRHGGVGIGLYITKKFTELLGGKLDVESEVGKGSTFTVTLPLDALLPASGKTV